MTKLFEVPPKERQVKLILRTYKGNRIALKIIRLLKKGGVYNVNDVSDSSENNRTFEVLVLSNKSLIDSLEDLKNEIISYIPDHFEKRYIFHFTQKPLGFVRSFEIEVEHIRKIVCYHKIKEINKRSITPEKNIFL